MQLALLRLEVSQSRILRYMQAVCWVQSKMSSIAGSSGAAAAAAAAAAANGQSAAAVAAAAAAAGGLQ